MFPETKRLSAEDAARAFDFDRKGHPLGEPIDLERSRGSHSDDKEAFVSMAEGEDKGK